MLGIKVLEGTVGGLRDTAGEAVRDDAPPAKCAFELDGHAVELTPWGSGAVLPRHGDRLILAGPVENGKVVTYAHLNLTQGVENWGSRFPSDLAYGWLMLVAALLIGWNTWNSASGPPYYGVPLVAGGFLAAFMALLGSAMMYTVWQKFHAWFLVRVASLRVLRGVVRDITPGDTAASPQMRMTLEGSQVHFPHGKSTPLAEGDDVIVAVQPHKGGWQGIALYNITQAASAKTWSTASQVGALLFFVIVVAFVGWLWIGTSLFNIIRHIIILIVVSGAVTMMVDRLYLRQFEREAWRRIQATRRTLAKAASQASPSKNWLAR